MVGGLQPPSALGEQEAIKAKGQGVIFVLEEAQLEVAQVGKVCKGAWMHAHGTFGPWPHAACHHTGNNGYMHA